MKKPQVISAQAQNRRGPIRYMLSELLAKATVWIRRKIAATEALEKLELAIQGPRRTVVKNLQDSNAEND